jgi:hypothetical protein
VSLERQKIESNKLPALNKKEFRRTLRKGSVDFQKPPNVSKASKKG